MQLPETTSRRRFVALTAGSATLTTFAGCTAPGGEGGEGGEGGGGGEGGESGEGGEGGGNEDELGGENGNEGGQSGEAGEDDGKLAANPTDAN